MEKYIPDVYQKSVYTIDYQKLKSSGIHCLLFDLDNTLVPASVKVPNKRIKELFEDLKEQGFQLILFSNSPKKRVKAFRKKTKRQLPRQSFIRTGLSAFIMSSSFEPSEREQRSIRETWQKGLLALGMQ